MPHSRRTHRRRVRILLCLLAGLTVLTLSRAAFRAEMPLGWSAALLQEVHRSTLPPALDADGDGLLDAEELELGRRFAPLVTLHANDKARPASVDWLRARAARKRTSPRLAGYNTGIRRGSSNPADWVTYLHVLPAHPSGVLVQYWFFYPFNDGPFFLGHEADWEHITVELDEARQPVGVWASRHDDNAPGRFRPWASLRKLHGTHPEILSALGTHASYFDLEEVPWYDRAGRCPSLEGPCRHLRWKTWQGGGLRPMGERQAPLDLASMEHSRPWGLQSLLPGCSAPLGPAFQPGWCAGGAPGCAMYGAY
jgi:hypothetical protein